MVLTNLEQSGFRKLKLTKPACDSPIGGIGNVGVIGNDGSINIPDLTFLLQLIRLSKTLEPNKLDVGQLLAQPSVVMLIDAYIRKQLRESSDSKKNAAKSVKYRSSGNQEYGRGHLTPAAYYYTMAIMYAPDVSENEGGVHKEKDNVDKKVPEELSLAYGNRSAVFHELGQYEAALADIEHSLATGYPREKQPKLLLRKVECLISLKHLQEAKSVWEQLCSTGKEPKDHERALKIRRQLLDIDSNYSQQEQQPQFSVYNAVFNNLTSTGRYQPSNDFASLSTKVEPQYSKSKGRHLVAKQDIEVGDILLVDSSFAGFLKQHFEYHFCHHCRRKLESEVGDTEELCITGSVVPCTQCTRVLFCSTGCRTQAWQTYHQYECSILSILYSMTHHGHHALRMLLATGLDVVQQVMDRCKKSKDPLSSLKINDPEDISACYGLVYQLTDHQDLIMKDKLDEFAIISAVLALLAKKCAFVRTDKQMKFAATVLLRHIRQLYSASCTIDCYDSSDSDKKLDFARVLHPYYASLMNHSCDPNAMNNCVQSNVLIVRATKRIPADSEVTINYSLEGSTEKELLSRREYLWESRSFWCECARCVLETRDGLNGKYFPIGCKDCGSTFTRASSSSDTFHCSGSSCEASMSLAEAQKLYAQIEGQLASAERLIATFQTNPLENHSALFSSEICQLKLARIPGMSNCWQMGVLHLQLSEAFQAASHVPKARHHFERYCEIRVAYSGIGDAVLNYQKLIDLYILDTNGDGDRRAVEHFRAIMNRTNELVRLHVLTDEQPTDDELDVDEAHVFWKVHNDLLLALSYLPKFQ